MSSTTDVNIVLGQGNAIKEVHNVRKQNLELNQQFVSQKAEQEKKEDQSKVNESETENRVEIKRDEERKNGKDREENGKGSERKKEEKESRGLEGNLIDITV